MAGLERIAMSDYAWVTGGLFVTFFLLILFADMAVYNSSVTCPDIQNDIQAGLTGSEANIITQVITVTGVLFSPCSGLPWWVYLLVFVPIGFGVIVFVTPFIGS
jgi:hypothetical protein